MYHQHSLNGDISLFVHRNGNYTCFNGSLSESNVASVISFTYNYFSFSHSSWLLAHSMAVAKKDHLKNEFNERDFFFEWRGENTSFFCCWCYVKVKWSIKSGSVCKHFFNDHHHSKSNIEVTKNLINNNLSRYFLTKNIFFLLKFLYFFYSRS